MNMSIAEIEEIFKGKVKMLLEMGMEVNESKAA